MTDIRNRIAAIAGLLVVLAARPAAGQTLAERLNGLLDTHVTAQRTNVSLRVVDLESGRVLFDRHGRRLLTPASTQKLFTSAAALDVLGPDHRFPTRVVGRGTLTSGLLRGELVLQGGGDAMLQTKDLARLADRVAEEVRVRRIEGPVVVDNSRYGSPLKGPGWMWDDDPDDYNMSITPLMVDFNVMRVRVAAEGTGRGRISLLPPSDYPPVLLEDGGPTGSIRIDRHPFEDLVRIRLGPGSLVARLTMHDPGPWAAAVFRRMLEDRGVVVSGTTAGPPATAEAFILEHEGSTVEDAVARLNQKSENAVGEVLLHELAIARGVARPAWSRAAETLGRWLTATADVDSGAFRIVDGSGLSRYNLASPEALVQVLQFMHGHSAAAVYRGSLPIYEVDLRGLDA
ncbi:MAG: D-alanyl-D-alanine carboxypeptidase/D-alanyl-D-alanine endopeptidase, partial [Planctomycetota bacterium]